MDGLAGIGKEATPVCILVHGYNGEPQDMQELADYVQMNGLVSRNLLLPGHGTSARDLSAYTWEDWYKYVLAETQDAIQFNSQVFVVGFSLGATLALAVTAHEPRVIGVVALCPLVRLSKHAQSIIRLLWHLVPYYPTTDDIHGRRGEVSLYPRKVYPWTPSAPLHSLLPVLPKVLEQLPNVRCPALVVGARYDHTVPIHNSMETFSLLGSADKDLLILNNSYHAVTRDLDRLMVSSRVLSFFKHVIEENS